MNVSSEMGNLVENPMQEYRIARGKQRSGDRPSPVGAAGRAVGQGFGRVGTAMAKTVVDLPLAMADGLHAVPSLYGEKVRDYGTVTGWKSGGIVGGKVIATSLYSKGNILMMHQSLAYGIYDGYTGLFKDPYKGAKEGGGLGFVKGVAKGIIGFLAKPGSGKLGTLRCQLYISNITSYLWSCSIPSSRSLSEP